MRTTKTMKAFIALFLLPLGLLAQVTTGSISGTIKDATGTALQGATVEAVHEPSGTKYTTASNKTGRYNLPGLRVGGPYKVTVTYVGFKTETASDVWIQLGEPSVIEFSLTDAKAELKEVTLSTTRKGALISKDRKGTSTNISSRLISSLPTLNRSITDITKLTPQSNGTSFAGQDNRAINFTLDGSIFNNSFGLQPLNGSQTNSSPISLDAIQELQINVSPYSLREAGFTGASINAVTKSGTNTLHGTGFYNMRNESLVGTKAGAGGKEDVITTAFDVKQYGISFGGPIIKNKLFFFANYEAERRTDLPPVAITTINSKLDSLATFLDSAYKYSTGGYAGYNMKTQSDKGVVRFDWNISDKHKLSVRGNFLTSKRDVQISNSNSIGGNRFGTTSISYANSNYEIHNDIYGVVAQLNSRISNSVSNEITFGFTANRDYRAIKGNSFPTVDIQNGSGGSLITFGVDPFTPNNKLNTDTWQFSDNLTVYKGKHTVSMGLSYESFTYLNGFTPRINGIYTFKSLDDFYTDARYMLANPSSVTMPKALGGYSATWSNLADGGVWYATTKARTIGAYVQDDYELNKNFNITYGVRFDIPFFANEGTKNTEVDNLSFVNEKGEPTKLSTSKLPGYKIMINPRIGFNYDVNGDKQVQIRGGLGLFTGRPPFVYVSNQMGNNGVMNGDVNYTGSFGNGTTTGPTATQIPFSVTTPVKPLVGYGYPASVAGQAASSYNIATTEQDFRFPQIFRSNLALDYKITKDVIGSVEGLFTQSFSNIFYYNANLISSTANFAGMDNRPRFGAVANGTLNGSNTLTGVTTPSVASIRINPKITDATVMKSGPYGGSFMTTLKLEKPVKAQGFGWMVAYNFGYSRDFINPSSIASSSWTANKSVNGNNRPDIAFSDYDVRNRLIANLNYRKEISKNVAVQFSLFYEGRNMGVANGFLSGRFSYAYTGDMNGDGVSGNDLMFIPTVAQVSQMKFENFTLNGVVQTQGMQQTAFENYISQDKYLSGRRGEYAERNGVLMPTVNRFDVSAMVELFKNIGKDRHTVQLRADIFNVGNLINSNSGVSYVVNTASPVSFRAIDNTSGAPVFRMTAVNNSINYGTYRKGTSTSDVWQMQLGIRYIF